jgi:hypothetical protein
MLGPAIRFQTQARDHTDALPAKKRAVDLASHFRSGDIRFGSIPLKKAESSFRSEQRDGYLYPDRLGSLEIYD